MAKRESGTDMGAEQAETVLEKFENYEALRDGIGDILADYPALTVRFAEQIRGLMK